MEGHHELLCVLTIRSSSILTPKRQKQSVPAACGTYNYRLAGQNLFDDFSD